MDVLSIHLEGFRSFKCNTNVEFTQGLNVIVGHNGAGKSNLLEALAAFLPQGDLAGETLSRRNLRHENCQLATVTVSGAFLALSSADRLALFTFLSLHAGQDFQRGRPVSDQR